MRRTSLFACLLLAAAALAVPAFASAPDNTVDWAGISHVTWLDRDPLCPVDGESFTVRFQTWASDLTAARVRVDDGAITWVDAAPTGSRGPYDVWTAQVPATAAGALSYYLELTDGADVDYFSATGMQDTAPADGGFALDFTTYSHAPVGATPTSDGGAVFRVWSPSSSTAHVRGEFNAWGTGNPMTQVGEHFIGRVATTSADQMYKYWFDSTTWNTDARARRLNASDNYNAYLIDPKAYDWQVEDFDVPDFEEMVIYQLHVGTFSGRNDPLGTSGFPGTYADVTARAEHLAELGINAVMLNPITEFPGDESAGYNPITAWAPEWKYGTPDDLKEMIDTLHSHGIAVLLDIVWNHMSSTDNFLWWYDGAQIYYDDPAQGTPWGDQMDLDKEEVRNYYADSALYWLDEFRMDGFRMDATDFMNYESHETAGWSLMQRLNDAMDNRAADKIAIAEQLPDDSWVTRPTSLGGAGFDSQYYDNYTDRLREQILLAGYGDPSMWSIYDILYGGGEYLYGRYVTNYVELHDECWPTSGGQRIVKTIDTVAPHDDGYAKGRSKLAQGLVLTSPGIPAMLMGTEWLEDTDFGTGWMQRIDWSKKTTYAGIFDYYSDLIHLRTSAPALRADAGVHVHHVNDSGNVIAFRRWDLDGNLHVVVANFSNTTYDSYRVGLPEGGTWYEAINSQDPAYEGYGPTNPGDMTAEAYAADGFDNSIQIGLPAMGLIVLTHGSISAAPELPAETGAALRLLRAYPNPFNPRVNVAFEIEKAGPVRASIVDVAGRHVRTLTTESFEAGQHTLVWNGCDDAGMETASGMYLLRLESAGAKDTAKLLLLR